MYMKVARLPAKFRANKSFKNKELLCNNKGNNTKPTDGCSVTTAKPKINISVITIKKVLSPQSCPDGVKKWKRSPLNAKVAT